MRGRTVFAVGLVGLALVLLLLGVAAASGGALWALGVVTGYSLACVLLGLAVLHERRWERGRCPVCRCELAPRDARGLPLVAGHASDCVLRRAAAVG